MRAMKPTDFLQGVAYGAGGGGGAAPSGSVEITQNGTYNVADKAQAVVDVPNTYGAADEGKVVSSGALVAQTQKQITANGTHDTTANNSVVVNVPSSQPVLVTKSITENGTYTASDDQADGYSEVAVNVSGGGGSAFSWAKFCSGEHDKDIVIDLTEVSGSQCKIRNSLFANWQATSLHIQGIKSNFTCSIEASAFWENTLTSIICESPLFYIDTRAFAYCTITGPVQFGNIWADYGDDDTNGISGRVFQNTQCDSMKFGSVYCISSLAFDACTVQTLDFVRIKKINATAFQNSGLKALILRWTGGGRPTLSNTNAFSGTPIANGTGYIYVPASLVSSFQSASNWSTFANQFRALESYTVDGTTTGELDPTKI